MQIPSPIARRNWIMSRLESGSDINTTIIMEKFGVHRRTAKRDIAWVRSRSLPTLVYDTGTKTLYLTEPPTKSRTELERDEARAELQWVKGFVRQALTALNREDTAAAKNLLRHAVDNGYTPIFKSD